MKRPENKRKETFLSGMPEITIEALQDKFQNNLRFSFRFFDNSQSAGQDFKDWSHEQLYKLFDKLKQYCHEPMNYWLSQPIGSGRGRKHVLEIYGRFPVKSDFIHPKFIPLDVDWARFRLEHDMRLIGFIVSQENCTQFCLQANTFYVVFLDELHKFYKSGT